MLLFSTKSGLNLQEEERKSNFIEKIWLER